MKFNLLLFSLFIFSSSVYAQNKFENLDVFELQYARDPQVSPDGSKIIMSYSDPNVGNSEIYVLDLFA